MDLFFREFGEGKPVVVLHGLYGSSDNWVSIGRKLAEQFKVYLVDQRNHGQSFHSPSHTYSDMANDLLQFFELHKLNKAIIIGHSMGGKVAMLFASLHPNLVEKMVVVDISPGGYDESNSFSSQKRGHEQIISSLLSLNVEALNSRQQADEALSKSLPDVRVRQFLLKNLQRDRHGNFFWSLNLNAVSSHINDLMGPVFTNEIGVEVSTKTLFIRGEKSPYISQQHANVIENFFPNNQLVTIPNAGHWVHAEQPERLIYELNRFLLP